MNSIPSDKSRARGSFEVDTGSFESETGRFEIDTGRFEIDTGSLEIDTESFEIDTGVSLLYTISRSTHTLGLCIYLFAGPVRFECFSRDRLVQLTLPWPLSCNTLVRSSFVWPLQGLAFGG